MKQFKRNGVSLRVVFLSSGRPHRWVVAVVSMFCCGMIARYGMLGTVVGQESGVNRPVVITFRVHLQESLAAGESVFLSGNHPAVGNWKPDGLRLIADSDGYYSAKIEVPLPVDLQFKLTRGSWNTVESDPDGRDRPNRTLVVDGPKTVELIVRGWKDKTRVTSRSSTVVGDLRVWNETSIEPSRAIRVWLPPGYGTLDDGGLPRRFPVLYMLDGQNLFDSATSAFGVEWQVDESLMRGIATGEIPGMIVVGIDNTAQRIEEYTHQRFEIGGKLRGGGADVFIEWLSGILKKKVDRKFHTLPERESTWIGGSSLAGLCALHAVLNHNQVFSKGLLFSPSVFWGNAQLIDDTVLQIQKVNMPVQLWVDFGDSEGNDSTIAKENLDRFVRFQTAVTEAIESKKTAWAQIEFSIVPGGKHNETSWSKRFFLGLKAIAN